MQFLRILLLCILFAVAFGLVHDQVTARVCVEYFTIGHPRVMQSESPTLLALYWGVVATWWVGLIMGVPLAVAARAGSRPKRSAGSLVRPLAWLMGTAAALALVAGIAGYVCGRTGAVYLVGPLAELVPAEKHAAFLADMWAHLASYAVGFLGGLVLIVLVWRSRKIAKLESPQTAA